MNIMTRRGSLDNIVTYEHFCDTKADLENIPSEYITLGSTAIVLQDDGGMEVYIAGSDKGWNAMLNGSGASSSNSLTLGSTTLTEDKLKKLLALIESEEVTP